MTDAEYIAQLRANLLAAARCPCCQEIESCAEGCTYAEDCGSIAVELLSRAREALRR